MIEPAPYFSMLHTPMMVFSWNRITKVAAKTYYYWIMLPLL
jgi:hypothetical protein